MAHCPLGHNSQAYYDIDRQTPLLEPELGVQQVRAHFAEMRDDAGRKHHIKQFTRRDYDGPIG